MKGGSNLNNNTVLSRVFTQNTLKSFLSSDQTPPVLCSVIRRYNIHYTEDSLIADVFSEIYNYIDSEYRNEYFYKNTLLNKLLINVHKINTTVALTEIPIARSKADFIMINGKAIVYEIKTELDTLERLENQVNDYYKAFDHVCVVSCESQKNQLIKRFQGSPVGIYILTKRNTIDRVQEPQEYKDALDLNCIFKILNKPEYESIVLKLKQSLPTVTQVKYYKECRRIICEEPLEKIYPMFLQELKKRNRIEYVDFSNVPKALSFLTYFSKLKKDEFISLQSFLNKKFIMED